MKKKIFSGLLWKFAERITAQAITMIVTIVLARMIDPDDFGAIAIVMVFITIANVFVSSGLGTALVQKEDIDNYDFSSVFFINVGIGLGIYCLIFLTAPLIASFYHMPILTPALRVLGIRIPVASINSVQQAYVSREMLFKRFFWSTLFGTGLSAVVGIWMARKGFGIWALVAQYLTNTCTDTIVLWFTVKWRPFLYCSIKRVKPLISYGWKVLMTGLIDTGYNQLRNLVIGKVFTPSDLAFYNQGEKYVSFLVANINSSISSVIFPAMSRAQDERERLKRMTRSAIGMSSFVLWPILIGLASVAEPLIRLLLTEKWLPCVAYLQIFCFSYALWPVHTANVQAISALGRSDLLLKMEIIKKALGIALIIISVFFSPFVMALSMLISSVIGVFINSYPNRGLLKYSFGELMSDVCPSMVMSIIMGVAVISFIKLTSFGDAFTLVLSVLIGAGIYVILAIIIKPKAYTMIMESIRNWRTRSEN